MIGPWQESSLCKSSEFYLCRVKKKRFKNSRIEYNIYITHYIQLLLEIKMPQSILDEQLKALRQKRIEKLAEITMLRKKNEYYEARLTNYRQGSLDIESSISRLQRTLDHWVDPKKNIQTPAIRKQALLDAIQERKRIIDYQTDDHDFAINSSEVEAYLQNRRPANNTSPTAVSPLIQDEAAAVNEEEKASETLDQAASPTEATKPESHSEILKESKARQLAKMDELLAAVNNVDFSTPKGNKEFQAFVDSELRQQHLMLYHFENTIKDETRNSHIAGKGLLIKNQELEAKLHDEYDKILLELRDENLKKADEMCRQYKTTNNESWPEVTKTQFFGPDNYREYSKDKDPNNIIQYFSHLASTGMFNGMEFGEASMLPRAKPTLKINNGKLELVEPIDQKLQEAFNATFSNTTVKKYYAELHSKHQKLFLQDDAKSIPRFDGFKEAATARLNTKIQTFAARQTALQTKACKLQETLDEIEKFAEPKKTPTDVSSKGYQRPTSTGKLGELKTKLDQLKACKKNLDAVKSFDFFGNDVNRALEQIQQIKTATQLLNQTTATLQSTPSTTHKTLDNKDDIKKAKADLEKKCEETLSALDKMISETADAIKPLQTQYFEYQRLQKACTQEQLQTKAEQVVAGIKYQRQLSGIPSDASYWSDVSATEKMAYVSIKNKTTDMFQQSYEYNYPADFYVALAKQSGVAPLTINSNELIVFSGEYKTHPFLIIEADGKITFPEGSSCPQKLQSEIRKAEKAAAKASAPTSAPQPSPTSAQPQATISGTGNTGQPVADINPARRKAETFIKDYNRGKTAEQQIQVTYNDKHPTDAASSFEVSASSNTALEKGLQALLQKLSTETTHIVLHAKYGNTDLYYKNGQQVDQGGHALKQPPIPKTTTFSPATSTQLLTAALNPQPTSATAPRSLSSSTPTSQPQDQATTPATLNAAATTQHAKDKYQGILSNSTPPSPQDKGATTEPSSLPKKAL